MTFIKKVFDDSIDESVHFYFQKFSRGKFLNMANIEAKVSGGTYKISTDSEFANDLVREVAKKMGKNKTKVSGAIVSTRNLNEIPKFQELLKNAQIKQFQGVKRYIIEEELSGEDILNFLNLVPRAFFAFSFESSDGTKLKIKPKAPKSGKPSNKGDDEKKVDFCKIQTKDKEIVKKIIFEKEDFSEARISHDFIIESLEIPEELKDSNDFAKMREAAIRIGKVIRKAKIDGEEIVNEHEFAA